MAEDVADFLEELQASVRAVGREVPNQATVISAIILDEKRRGHELEDELLLPFRLNHPDA